MRVRNPEAEAPDPLPATPDGLIGLASRHLNASPMPIDQAGSTPVTAIFPLPSPSRLVPPPENVAASLSVITQSAPPTPHHHGRQLVSAAPLKMHRDALGIGQNVFLNGQGDTLQWVPIQQPIRDFRGESLYQASGFRAG